MRYALAALVAALCSAVVAEAGDRERARAALALSLALAGPTTPTPGTAEFLTDYKTAADLAARERKLLYVWVAYKCPSSANQILDAVHVFVDRFQGDDRQRVVVAVPDGSGWLHLAGEVQAEDCCASELRRVVERHDATHHATPPTAPTVQGPTWTGSSMGMGMVSRPMMMGGWGGSGFRGGRSHGGGGGACAT